MKKWLAVPCMLLMFILGACSTSYVSAEQTNPLKIWFQNENGCYSTLNVVDEETGVHYVVASKEFDSRTCSISICPRYNADGTLYVEQTK